MAFTEAAALNLLARIIQEHSPKDIWTDATVAGYRRPGNTSRGETGEEFLRRYLARHDSITGNGNRTSKTDLRIGSIRFEVKTASLGAGGTFQFNHVRMDRDYHDLPCLGSCPDKIVFNMWRKGLVAEAEAGTLARMAEASLSRAN